ncbi:MAG: hypothetical protein ABI885_03185 [Gammaproteobacteria bacterium]
MPRLASRGLAFALLFGTAAAVAATTAPRIPVIQGLTLVRAASERQGDYESTLIVDDLDADGVIHLSASAELPDPAGGKAAPVAFSRVVGADDRDHALAGRARNRRVELTRQ